MSAATGLPAVVTIQRPAAVRLSLLEAFELRRDGVLVVVPLPAQRLLAFLALQTRPVSRSYVAEMLWLDSTKEHAWGSLRSALWQLNRPGGEVMLLVGGCLQLAPLVAVDARELDAWACGVLAAPDEGDGQMPEMADLAGSGSGELLPAWYDDWLVVERERLRDLRARALERLCEQLTGVGSFRLAMQAALAAVGSQPLRESAHRCVIGVSLAEGNQAEALRWYLLFRDRLRDELGLAPSTQMVALVGGLIGQ